MSTPSDPLVSVVIPAYNAEITILETIESVRKQTFSSFEIIVINDGSTDNTLELVNSVDDPRLKVFSYENGGLSTARNRGIFRAQGEFIAFLDADDLWTADKLELQVQALRNNPAAGVAYSWTLVVDEKGQGLYPGVSVSFEGNVYQHLLTGNFIASGSNVMLRRQVTDLVGEFDPELKSSEDWEYWLRVALHFSFVVVPKSQVLYRQSSTTMSSNFKRMENYMLLVHTRAFETAPEELKFLKNRSLCFIYRYVAKLHLTRGFEAQDFNVASSKLSKAIRLYPKTLLGRETQKLLFKVLFMRLLSPRFAGSVLQRISRMRAISMKS